MYFKSLRIFAEQCLCYVVNYYCLFLSVYYSDTNSINEHLHSFAYNGYINKNALNYYSFSKEVKPSNISWKIFFFRNKYKITEQSKHNK